MDKNRIFAKINLDNLIFNIASMKANLPAGTNMLAVIKTNAYGHGAVPIAKVLSEKRPRKRLCSCDDRRGA